MDNVDIIHCLQYANASQCIQQANTQVLKVTQEMAHYEMVCHILEHGHSA